MLDIEVLSLTDHDTLDGLEEFDAEGEKLGIRTISGVELSVDIDGGSLHLLGYGFRADDRDLKSILIELKESRQVRNQKIIHKLQELGYDITLDGVSKRARNGVMGRLHIAAELVAAGRAGSINEAFAHLLKRGGAAYFDRRRLTMFEACTIIHQAGGAAVWAHPGLHTENLSALIERLPDWKKEGLDGVESDYSAHSIEQSENLREIAGKLGLIVTGGSDFHGSYRPGVELGQGPEGSQIREECYFQLRERIHEITTSRVV